MTVDLKERAPSEGNQALAQARTRLLEARKELRAAAAEVSEWESSRPKPRRFPVFAMFGGQDELTAPEHVERRLATAQEAVRVAQAELQQLEAADEDLVLA